MHSVLHEVVEHLEQSSSVCRDNAVGRSLADDLNTLGCFFLRPRRGCGRAQIVQRDGLKLKLNRSGKVEQTADDRVETVDLFEDHRAAPFSRFGIGGALPHLRPHPDGAERIAQLMRDTGSKLSQCRESFIVAYLRLQRPFVLDLFLQGEC